MNSYKKLKKSCWDKTKDCLHKVTCGNVSKSVSKLEEATGFLVDFWDVDKLNEPISSDKEINAMMDNLLDENYNNRNTKYEKSPTILKFQMYMLTATDGQNRNVLHIACKYGLHIIIKFLVKKMHEFGCYNYAVRTLDFKGMSPLYNLC